MPARQLYQIYRGLLDFCPCGSVESNVSCLTTHCGTAWLNYQ